MKHQQYDQKNGKVDDDIIFRNKYQYTQIATVMSLYSTTWSLQTNTRRNKPISNRATGVSMRQNNIMMYSMTMIQLNRNDYIIMHTIILLKYRILHYWIQGQIQSIQWNMYPHSTRVNHTTQVQSTLNNCRITTVIDWMESHFWKHKYWTYSTYQVTSSN